MNTEDDFNIACRYRTVRKHLDNLGYKHALTLDALPLIEKLLADLIQTTESLKHFKSIAQENVEIRTQLQSAIDPYKCDNVRLVQECNRLHLDLTELKDSHQKQIKELKREIYKLESECNDLQLASSRNLQKIKELETESSKKTKKILELQGKCIKPTISNVGLGPKKRSCYPLRRPVIESEPLPKTTVKINPLPNLTVEPKVVDILSMADYKMNCLSHEVTKLKGELAIQTDNVQTLKSQLAAKEKEIIRLKKMLEGGRPYSVVSKDCPCKKTENNFITSNEKVDINELKTLQQAKVELEQQLKEALNKQHDAMSQALKLADRNEELEKELRDIDHIALAVEADCNSAVKENNKRVSKLQQKLEDVMTQVHVLEGELTVEHREVQELRADLEACRLEKRNIQRTLESTLDEKKQMTDRINELTVIEKNLNDEIERLAKENEKQRQDIVHLQYTNKVYDGHMHVNRILDDDGIHLRGAKEKGRKNDSNTKGQNGEFQELYKERENVQNVNIGYDHFLKQLEEKETQINNLQQSVEQIRRERDFYKDEYNNIKDYQTRTFEKDNVDLWSRIRNLKQQLSERDSALDELQREKKELFREKVNLETRLQTYKTEHQISHRPCNVCKHSTVCKCSPLSMKDVGMTKGIVERLEHERDIARADVERLIEERDALHERLKMAAEAHTSEQRRLRENLTEVETRLKQIEKERHDLLRTQGARRATINGLEDQLQDLREQLKRTKQELATQRTQYFQLRALQDQTDQALGDAQNQLAQSGSDLNKALDRNRAMERQQMQLENQVKEFQQDISNLKANIRHLDHEKDQLLMVLDEKTERIAALEREIMLKGQQVMGSEQQVRELQQKNEISIDQSAEQERQLRTMQLELENLQRQLQTASYDRENAIQENRRVQDDLAAVTCEVRNLQRELETSRAESFDLKRQLQTYVSEVRRAEELLNRKENERTEMLNHFRSLSMEATVLENNNHSLESEAAEARGALHSARDRLLDLERQLADRDCLIRGYETQISELTQNVASMETQLRQQEGERNRAEADLTTVRDLCVKLDQQKDTLMHQLDDKDSLKTQYDMQIAKLKAEQAVIQDQMARDRATVERLEMLLDQARQESITVQTNNQELQNEMSRLRQKMSELNNKLSSESAKLRQYQTQAAEYCKQISELRRQVTNERFDRARKEEETRRQSEGFPASLTQSPSPSIRIPIESNEATNRYLQKEGNGEQEGIADSGMKTENMLTTQRLGYLTKESYCRCNSSYVVEGRRDVACINIILRSECKTSNKCSNRLQKEINMIEKKPMVRSNEELIKKDVGSPNTYVSQFQSPTKRYDNTAFNSETWSNLSQPAGTQYRGKYNGESGESTFNNSSRIQNESSPLSYSTNEIWKNEVRRKLMYSTSNEDSNRPIMLSKEAIEVSSRNEKNDKIINMNKRESNIESSKKVETDFVKHVSATTLQNGLKTGRENKQVSVQTKMELPSYLRRVEEIEKEPDSEKTNLKSSLEETIEADTEFTSKQVSSKITPDLSDWKLIKETKKSSSNIDLKSNLEKVVRKKKDSGTLVDSKFIATNALPKYDLKTIENSSKFLNYMTPQMCSPSDCPATPHAGKNVSKGTVGEDTSNGTEIRHTCNYKNDYKKYKTVLNSVENTTDKIILERRKLQGLPTEESVDFCTNTNCNASNYSKLPIKQENQDENRMNIKSVDHVIKENYSVAPESVQDSIKTVLTPKQKPITVDTTLDTLESVLKRVEKSNHKASIKHGVPNYYCLEEKCKSVNCNYVKTNKVTLSEFNDNLYTSESIKPECMKILMEIKEHTKILEEQLTIMNKNMKIKRKVTDKSLPSSDVKNIKHQRDTITQNPEKKNVCVQQPSNKDINYVKCTGDSPLKWKLNSDLQLAEREDKSVQQIDKRKKKKEMQTNTNFKESTLNNKDILNYKENLSLQTTKQIEPTHKDVKVQVTMKDRVNSSDVNSSKEISNLQDQEKTPTSFTFDHSNFQPVAASTPKKLDLLTTGHGFCYASNCFDKSVPFKENFQKEVTQLRELVNHSMEDVKDTHRAKTVIMLFLTKSVHNRYLKSKYKKFGFMNFKPKCIVDSYITSDQRSMKYKTPRRKMLMPAVFGQLKSVDYKIEKYCDADTCDTTKDQKASDVSETVCTQSSNLYITTATSISNVRFRNKNSLENFTGGRSTRKEACVLS